MLAGEQVAAGWGVSSILADFDVETYSEAGLVWNAAAQRWESLPGFSVQKRGLSATGVRAYVEHPTFELLMVAYDLKDGRGKRQWVMGDPPPLDLFEHIKRGGLLEAHNSGFEFQVWNFYCVPRLGWPPLRLRQMRCSMAKARAFALPGGLKDVGKVLSIANQKLADGDRLVRKWTMPRNPTKANPALRLVPEADPEDWELFKRYNVRDIEAEAEVSARCPDLSEFEQRVWFADQAINQRGLHVDAKAIDDCIAIVEQAYQKYNAELRYITNGAVESTTELDKLKEWCAGQGVDVWSMDEEGVEDALKRLGPAEPDTLAVAAMMRNAVRRALTLRQLLSSASVKKLWSLRAAKSSKDRIHDLFVYYSARTGRWAGMGPQPQNLYKGKWKDIADIELALSRIATRSLELVEYHYGDALETVNNCLRSLFTAAPGHDFVCSDYSAIEGVVTAALAGEEWRLEVFRTHGMIYETSASRICRIPLQDFIDHKKKHGTHHPMRNKIGKFAELACGFGGWIGAMKGFGADEFLTEDEMVEAVIAWREASPMIVELWGGQTRGGFGRGPRRPELFGLEGAAVSAIKYPGQAFTYREIGFQVYGDVLYMRLPSGRLLCYHEPRLAPSSRKYAQPWELEISFSGWNSNPLKGPLGWQRMKLYGGILTENAVQATARDILAGALVRLEDAGYAVVYHCHDEVLAEVPKGWGSVEELERLMTPTEKWCAGWPIKAAGGWRKERYGKFE